LRYTTLTVVLLFGCACEEQVSQGIPTITEEFTEPEPEPELDLPAEEPKFDPYAGHESWCEELEPPPCAPDRDNPRGSCTPSKIGTDRRCITPYWYKPVEDEKMGLCIPVYLGWSPKQEKTKMDLRRARLRHIVRNSCQYPRWARKLKSEWGSIDCGRVPGRSKHMQQCTEKTFCDPDKLYSALSVVAKREGDWVTEKVHNLPEDVEASAKSWLRVCRRELYKDNEHFGKCYKDGKKWRAIGDEWRRWRTYGYFGQNSNYRVLKIDTKAPPEIMCHEVYGYEAYMRAMRQAWGKYDKGVDCKDANGKRYNRELLKNRKQKRDGKPDTWPEKTWYTLHRAASSGALCPRDKRPETEGVKTKRQYYGARMTKVGLDLNEVVTWEMLGTPLPKKLDELHVEVRSLMTDLDARFPAANPD
jgi:hypothetical protein